MKKCGIHKRDLSNGYIKGFCNHCLLEQLACPRNYPQKKEITEIDGCLCEEIHPTDIPCIVCDSVDYIIDRHIEDSVERIM